MSAKLKIDLHTHPIAALKERMGIKGIADIKQDVAAEVIKAVKAAGLNGIAITEKNNFNHGWVTCLEILDHFPNEKLIFLPGTEIEYKGISYIQLFIPPYLRRRISLFNGKEWFYILANNSQSDISDIKGGEGVKIDAVEGKTLRGDWTAAQEISKNRNIPLIQASGAQTLEDIGKIFMEL
jgi:hypothetical protein